MKPFQTLIPNTCACVIITSVPYDERKNVLKFRCRSHNTPKECLDFNKIEGVSDSNARTQREKPQFQRS